MTKRLEVQSKTIMRRLKIILNKKNFISLHKPRSKRVSTQLAEHSLVSVIKSHFFYEHLLL